MQALKMKNKLILLSIEAASLVVSEQVLLLVAFDFALMLNLCALEIALLSIKVRAIRCI